MTNAWNVTRLTFVSGWQLLGLVTGGNQILVLIALAAGLGWVWVFDGMFDAINIISQPVQPVQPVVPG